MFIAFSPRTRHSRYCQTTEFDYPAWRAYLTKYGNSDRDVSADLECADSLVGDERKSKAFS